MYISSVSALQVLWFLTPALVLCARTRI